MEETLSAAGPSRLLNNDAAPSEHDRSAREKNAGSANSSAICATEDVLSRRQACSEGRGFVVQQPPKAVTAFICANCSRPAQTPDSAGRSRPVAPGFDWPFPVQEVLVPCTGRLQPEHVLKAFECGADLVLTVSCEQDNCQYLQGGERWARRVDYVRAILDEIGLGGERLLLYRLPGCAAEDMALGAGRPTPACSPEDADARVAAIRTAVLKTLDELAPNPLCAAPVDEAAEGLYQQADTSDEADED